MSTTERLTGPPTRKWLKQVYLDQQRNDFHQDVLNCGAHMILAIDDPEEVVRVGLEFMTAKLSACRADMGFMREGDAFYRPLSVVYNVANDPPQCDDVVYPARLGVFRRTWYAERPIVCNDTSLDPLLDDSRKVFLSIQSRSILFQRLSVQGKGVGMICVDHTRMQHEWTPAETAFVDDFTRHFFAPLAFLSRQWCEGEAGGAVAKPSPAELEAIRLAAKGLTFKSIARHLGKSARTIENQIRNARETVGAATLGELISRCEFWL